MKKLFSGVFALLLCQSSTLLNAQYTPAAAEVPYIEVTGNAELNIVPDEIFIDIRIMEKYDGKTKITIQEQETKMRTALNSIGLGPNALSLSSANADFVRVNWKTDDLLTQKKYVLKVKDAETAGKVFKELGTLEIKNARISHVNHTKMDSLLKEVKILAIKAAKSKADYLLDAIGEKRGNALIITENMAGVHPELANALSNVSGLYRQNRRVEEEFYGGADEEAVQFQKIQLTSSVYVKFAIRQ